ncbi:MAG: iron ABC transporter substrate-binding protein, partial [Burkholderiaceae bacterium]|nr:iron ABC transporter substrate-binding protein [Burkholderiaceae bacterium]
MRIHITRLLASVALAGATGLAAPARAQDGGQLNVICSVQADWCNGLSTAYARATGVKL